MRRQHPAPTLFYNIFFLDVNFQYDEFFISPSPIFHIVLMKTLFSNQSYRFKLFFILIFILRHDLLDILPYIFTLIICMPNQHAHLSADLSRIDLPHLRNKDPVVLCLHQILLVNQQLFIQLLSRS